MRNDKVSLLFGLQHKLPEGEVMNWWFDVDSENLKEELSLCFNVFFFSSPGTGGGIGFEFRSLHLLLCLH